MKQMKKVLTVGVYDLLHIGHIELFRRAKAKGDYLIVAVQESDWVNKFKPNANLVYSTEERMYMVRSIRFVDEVITYTEVDKIVQEVDFDIFITGPDQVHNGFKKAIEWCGDNGKHTMVLPRTEGISSSMLRIYIQNIGKKL